MLENKSMCHSNKINFWKDRVTKKRMRKNQKTLIDVWWQDIKTIGISSWNWHLSYPKHGCNLCNVEKPKK